MNENLKKLCHALRNIKITMLTTHGEDGCLYSRPMATQKIDENNFDGKLWFLTDLHSPKVGNIENDLHVNLAYTDPNTQKYISLSGRANMIENRSKIKELWTPMMKTWFPEGIEDPSIGLMCVEVDSAQLWDSPGPEAVQLLGTPKAFVRSERNQSEKRPH